MPSSSKGKGKAQAQDTEPTERDPLLPSSSTSRLSSTQSPAPPRSRILGPRVRSILLTSLIVLFSILLSALLFLILLAWSFKPSESELNTLPKTALGYAGPDGISVLNIMDNGVLVNVSVRLGIDADQVLAIRDPHALSEDERKEAGLRGDRGSGAEWWESIRRWTARQALARLSSPSVRVTFPSEIIVRTTGSDVVSLVSLAIDQPLDVPLIQEVTPDDGNRWLRPVTFTALAHPMASSVDLWSFVHRAWMDGQVNVMVEVDKVEVKLPEKAWWAKYAQGVKEDMEMALRLDVPQLPGLPNPGHYLNLTSLVHLNSYSLQTTPTGSLSIIASASLPNPLRDRHVPPMIPYAFPFRISLADGSPMAEVITSPIYIDDSPTLNLSMSGLINPDLTEKVSREDRQVSSLSFFLQNYLHGLDNPIVVDGLNTMPNFVPFTTVAPPSWILALMPSLSIPLTFPGPSPPPKVIQSVAIEHMRISEKSGKILASGTVVAEVELPSDMQRVRLDVREVLPDVLVYDGEPEDDATDPEEPAPNAFGRIKPDEYLESTTELSQDPDHPYRMIVTAPMKDVPPDVLEGRDAIFRGFASKVVFKGGAQAGIKGTASVRVDLRGVSGRATLEKLPVKGEFWVGRSRFGLG